MVFKKEYRIYLAFKKENVRFKNIYVSILEFMKYSKIEIELIGFQNKNAIHARILEFIGCEGNT